MDRFFEERALPSQRGVVYLSTIPRDIMPSEIRVFFQQYGEIFRTKFNVVSGTGKGTNRAVQFKEGWLEYESADDAREAAEGMNGKAVSVKRTRRAFGQQWHAKFLPGFVWDDLATEAESTRREHKQRRYLMLQEERKMNEQFRRMVRQRALSKERKAAERAEERALLEVEDGDGVADEGEALMSATEAKPQKRLSRKRARLDDTSAELAESPRDSVVSPRRRRKSISKVSKVGQ